MNDAERTAAELNSQGWADAQRFMRETAQQAKKPLSLAERAELQADEQNVHAVDSPNEPCTELANGRRFLQLCEKNIRYVSGMGWHKWNETHWTPDDLEPIRQASKIGKLISAEAANVSTLATCEDKKSYRTHLERNAENLNKWARMSESRQKIEAAIALGKPWVAVEADKLDADPWLLATTNGTVELKTGTLREPNRADLITKRAAVEYRSDADCPLWEKTLREVFAHDKLLVPYVQRVMGYCLTGSVKEQVMFICHGGGSNGKNTIIGSVMKTMGPYAVQAARNLLMKSNNERHPTELFDLKGARMAVASETAESKRMDESLVKSLTGDDFIRARRMREDFIEFIPTHKLLLLTNHKPIIEGSDYAIWRRIHLIPFTQTFTKEQRDLDLIKKLEKELPGILRWCVQGCLEWQRIGLQPPPIVQAATNKYRGEQDALDQFFKEQCRFTQTEQVQATSFYRTYKAWCVDTGSDSKSRNWIWERLEEREVTKRRTTNGYNYYGVGLL